MLYQATTYMADMTDFTASKVANEQFWTALTVTVNLLAFVKSTLRAV